MSKLRGLCVRVAAAIVVAGALVCPPTSPARADYDETEARLKLAGIDESLRTKIHAAIERGVRYLLDRQARDGAFRDPDHRHQWEQWFPCGYTALCSLALAHAGLPDARAGAELGLSYLCPDGNPRGPLVDDTYTAGAAAMLIAALHGDAGAVRRIGSAAAVGLNPKHDWWDYRVGKAVAEHDKEEIGFENMSTTQFGALALWAAQRAGGASYSGAWRRHLDGLCTFQATNGSWSYFPTSVRFTYPTGTCMGFANLVLARAALEDELVDEPVLAARAELAQRRARIALERDATAVLGLDGVDSRWNYYSLWALEKTCVFADLDLVGGKQWYIVGAAKLLAAQRRNGSWGVTKPHPTMGLVVGGEDGDLADTSFALLFLLRGSETFRPVTPRDVDLNRRVETPSAPRPPAKAGPASDPAPRPVSAEAAAAALDRLEALLRDRRAERSDVLRAIDDVVNARRGLGANATAEWLDRSESGLVKTFRGAFSRVSSRRDDEVAVRAAQALAGARPGVSGEMREAMGDALRHVDAPSRVVLGAAFTALGRLGDPTSVDWLVARVTAGTRREEVRSARAALGALAEFKDAAAMDRLQAATRIVRVLAPVEAAAASESDDDVDVLAAKVQWRALGAPALIALEHLCVEPRTAAPPVAADGAPLVSVADYGKWLARHRDVRESPWK